jgi:hypothetical protein
MDKRRANRHLLGLFFPIVIADESRLGLVGETLVVGLSEDL